MNEFRGELDGHGLRVTLLVSRFNEEYGLLLIQGAMAELLRLGVAEADLEVISVPGALELPPAAALRLAREPAPDALVALGAVIRGETSHHELVARECARGLAELSRGTGVPVAFGVLTTENDEQALERAHPERRNKGAEAARAAVEMARLAQALRGEPDRAAR
ncbi:MAG TPA: 6,7-dimethyl-8-ribityllumazine synthase [Candidatus Saccharimonadales bacterium]|nr:6,7-dimethyl-8-ribityllumazine synthase [Candidatus Saccharimonadales bacterium]